LKKLKPRTAKLVRCGRLEASPNLFSVHVRPA
jgi:hypothetical protein